MNTVRHTASADATAAEQRVAESDACMTEHINLQGKILTRRDHLGRFARGIGCLLMAVGGLASLAVTTLSMDDIPLGDLRLTSLSAWMTLGAGVFLWGMTTMMSRLGEIWDANHTIVD